VLEAEQRLLSSDPRLPQDIAVATTPPSNKPQQSAPADDIPASVNVTIQDANDPVTASNGTSNASIAVGFKEILTSSISKLIERIQGQASKNANNSAEAKKTVETSITKKEDDEPEEIRFDFAEGEGETFLDQLLQKLSVGKSVVEKDHSFSDSDEDALSKLKNFLVSLRVEEKNSDENEEEDKLTFLLPKKRPSATKLKSTKKSTAKAVNSLEQLIKQLRAENIAKKQISSIFDEMTDEDDLFELALDDSISRGAGRKVGSSRNFIQEELNAAALESEQLSVDLAALLAELEGR